MHTNSAPSIHTLRRDDDPRRHASFAVMIGSVAAVVIAVAACFTPAIAQSGWQDEERLTFDDAISYGPPNNAKYVAVDALERVHVVWSDERDRNREIYHMVKSNCVWTQPENLFPNR